MQIKNLILSDDGLKSINEGRWIRDIPGADGMEVLVLGLRSKEAQYDMVKRQAAVRQKNGGKPLTDEQLTQCTLETLAAVVLKDWKGIKDGKKEVKYSQELATQWITTPNGEVLAEMVLKAAQRVDAEANDFVEAVSKN